MRDVAEVNLTSVDQDNYYLKLDVKHVMKNQFMSSKSTQLELRAPTLELATKWRDAFIAARDSCQLLDNIQESVPRKMKEDDATTSPAHASVGEFTPEHVEVPQLRVCLL